jgi:CubicO group peptidase (beta-lactamase class C family)
VEQLQVLGDRRLGQSDHPGELAGRPRASGQQLHDAQPGTGYSYSNSGFIVLGALIERITGRRYDDYVHEHVFRPAGMTHTDVRVYEPREIPGMAQGYVLTDPATGTLSDNSSLIQIGNPSGGAISTVDDMLGFARALTGHVLLDPAMTDTVTTGKVRIRRPGGPADDWYAYGFEEQLINGVRIVGHNGGTPGYEGQLDIYPELGYVVVILTNQDQVMVPAIQRSESMLTLAAS